MRRLHTAILAGALAGCGSDYTPPVPRLHAETFTVVTDEGWSERRYEVARFQRGGAECFKVMNSDGFACVPVQR